MTNNDYDKKFSQVIGVILGHEGGYNNDPDDLGGETKYGISKASYPYLDIPKLSLEEAKNIYYCDYWKPERYCEIADLSITIKLFSSAVNMGPRTAHRLIQQALRAVETRVVEDGWLGSKTINAINIAEPISLLSALKSEAAGHYRVLVVRYPEQKKFLKGWLNRAYS